MLSTILALTFVSVFLIVRSLAESFLPAMTSRKIGGIRFFRVGRLSMSYCVAKS